MPNDFKWRHFQGEIILCAVCWYCKYGVSYSDSNYCWMRVQGQVTLNKLSNLP